VRQAAEQMTDENMSGPGHVARASLIW